ncbi:thiolase family protein [Streptomyces sp. NPDC056909]|uniref:thiolase family protein n=1 Tax=Streptomyces sp. NPDC056909 TaxID=3345963 RepID=UPI0036C1E114
MSDEVYLIDGARTAQGHYGGALASVLPDDLAALVVGEAVRRAAVPADAVDEVILGAANQAGEDNRDVARMAVLLAGLPHTVPGYTVNRLCASGLTAVATAAQAIRSGEAEPVVAGGVESMTRAPWVMEKPGTPWARPGPVYDTALGWRFTNPRFTAADRAVPTDAGPRTPRTALSMGETAEEVAALDGITRAESDAFALRSHQRSLAAQAAGHFDREIVPVPVKDGEFTRDEGPRATTTLKKPGALRTVFRKDGIVTAGSSSLLGHPLGCFGARILLTLLGRLEREDARRGLATLCMGVGQGVAMLVERV